MLLLLFSMRLRLVYADGSVAYENGDLTPVRALSSHCQCGYKHWWNGREYDNPPDLVSVISYICWFGCYFNCYTCGTSIHCCEKEFHIR